MNRRSIKAIVVSALCVVAVASESRAETSTQQHQQPNQIGASVTPPTATITRRSVSIIGPSATVNGRRITIESLTPQQRQARTNAKKEFMMQIVREESQDLRTLEAFRRWQAARRAARGN